MKEIYHPDVCPEQQIYVHSCELHSHPTPHPHYSYPWRLVIQPSCINIVFGGFAHVIKRPVLLVGWVFEQSER